MAPDVLKQKHQRFAQEAGQERHQHGDNALVTLFLVHFSRVSGMLPCYPCLAYDILADENSTGK